MASEDTLKIIVIVICPILFFTLLFGAIYLYRRYRCSFRRGNFRNQQPILPIEDLAQDGQIWDPSRRNARFQHNHSSRGANPDKQTCNNNNPEDYSSKHKIALDAERRASSLVQPHFQDKVFAIRRISSNPLLPDSYTRVNSFCSTLDNANPSSELLPVGAGRKPSFTSLEPNVQNHLSVRRVSAGGQEDQIHINSLTDSPKILEDTCNRQISSQEKQTKISRPPRITTTSADRASSEDSFAPHPFSQAALQRSSFISPTIDFPVPHVRMPERSRPRPQRPGTLVIPSTSPVPSGLSSDRTLVERSGSLVVPTATSTQALKSASSTPSHSPQPKSSIDTCSSFGTDPVPIEGQGYFTRGWNGFQQHVNNQQNQMNKSSEQVNIIPRIEIPISPTTPRLRRKGTISDAFRRLNENAPSSHGAKEDDAEPHERCEADEKVERRDRDQEKGHKKTPSDASKITYLADVVKEDQEQKRVSSSRQSTPVSLYPPNDIVAGPSQSSIGGRPPTLSPLKMEHGLGVHSGIAAGLGVGMVVGMSQGGSRD
ncbi:uncharacterized protein I303_107093 [Kwoniella dejecticola CBS 10117]|uniref:Uncharacterized protein n=1 Tax=Kwoniella dejecticola CBS 10117 TaxID=1296121 RepID=A0A1A5ZYQ1_9TREE|nr:uncharacterized protein I303_06494 [Kwoniella dejecticola CBS 10117]OBR82936.1 hypothetical protein I303_06494 [Kwoniella dejecticola CBS 10117]